SGFRAAPCAMRPARPVSSNGPPFRVQTWAGPFGVPPLFCVRRTGGEHRRMTGSAFWQYWYFHLPNFALAVLAYTLLGRFALSFFLPPDSTNYIWRWFCRLTDWVLVGVRAITPRYVMFLFLPLIGA